jgi:hypothetical protein
MPRNIEFFQRVANYLLKERFNPRGFSPLADEQVFEEVLQAAAAALFNTVNLNQGASVETSFKDIVDIYRACYTEDEHPSSAIRSAHQNIQRVKDRLLTGDMIACAPKPLPDRHRV